MFDFRWHVSYYSNVLFFHFREKKPRQQSGDHENLMTVVSPCAHVCVCFKTSAAYLSTVPTSCRAEGNRGKEPSRVSWPPRLCPLSVGFLFSMPRGLCN